MSGPERNGILKHLWGGIVAILLTLFIQTGSAIFWAGMMSARMGVAEHRIDRLEDRMDAKGRVEGPVIARDSVCSDERG